MLPMLLPLLLAVTQIDDETLRRPTASEIQRTHQLLAGTWNIVSVVDDGERLGAELIRQKVAADGNVVIADRSIQIMNPETGTRKQWMFRLDLSRNPRRMDVITPDDRLLRGVFKFEDDDLVLCVPHHDETKIANGFDAPTGSGLMLVRMKTATTAAPQPVIGDVALPEAKVEEVSKVEDLPTPRRASETEIRRQHDLLAGDWDILSITNNGEEYAPDLIRSKIAENGRIHIGERGFYLVNPRTEIKRVSNMRIDPTLTPHTIEVTSQFDDVLKGIYEFDGDKLRVCLNKRDGDPVPTEFTAPANSNRAVYVLRMARAPQETVRTVQAPPVAPVAPAAPKPPPQPDKNQQVRELLVGSWVYTDRKGTVTTVLQRGGTFVATRVANRKRLFEPDTVTSSGRWDYKDGILNAGINRSNDSKLLNHAFVFRVQSIGENTMVASDLFGELQNFRRLR